MMKMVGLSPMPKARTIKGIQAIGEIGRKSPISGSNAFANFGEKSKYKSNQNRNKRANEKSYDVSNE